VEIRSLNHRYLDCRVKLPLPFAAFEEQVRKRVQATQERGRVEVSLRRDNGEAGTVQVEVDLELARGYYQALSDIAEALGINEHPGIMDVVKPRRGLSAYFAQRLIWSAEWDLLAPALDPRPCKGLYWPWRRARGGQTLAADLRAPPWEGFLKNLGLIRWRIGLG